MWPNQSLAFRLFENGVEKNFERKNQYGFDKSSELHYCQFVILPYELERGLIPSSHFTAILQRIFDNLRYGWHPPQSCAVYNSATECRCPLFKILLFPPQFNKTGLLRFYVCIFSFELILSLLSLIKISSNADISKIFTPNRNIPSSLLPHTPWSFIQHTGLAYLMF